ncbi:MAG: hypothetical protein ACRDZO_12225 [Egibacteraceae bacterium]
MAAWGAQHGIGYLDGAIMTPTETIGGPAAVVLYRGPEGRLPDTSTDARELGRHRHVPWRGPQPGGGARRGPARPLLDLHELQRPPSLAGAERIAAKDLASFAKGIGDPLPGIIAGFVSQVDGRDYPGRPVHYRVGPRRVWSASFTPPQTHGIDTSVLSAAVAIAQRAIDAGHGSDGFTRLAEVLRKSPPAQ